MRSARVVAATFLFGGLLPLGMVAPAACAAEGPHAALIVDTEVPGGQYRYCVALPDDSVSGIELIELASEQHGLQYRLGYGGNVVCQLAGVGYDSDECLKAGPEFWGYWRGDGSGGWEWSSSGGNSTQVQDGDVEGWSWGAGNDGSSHPAPPETTFESVCGRSSGDGGGGADEPKDEGPRDGRKAGPKKGKASAAIPSTDAQNEAAEGASVRRDKPRKDRREGRKEEPRKKPQRDNVPRTSLSPPPAPVASSSAPSASPTSAPRDGPPAGGLLATGAVAACIGGAVFLQRRRVRAR